MSVVVGYIATPEGDAALDAAAGEARRRGTRLVVVVSERGHRVGTAESDLDTDLDHLRDRLLAGDIDHEVRRSAGGRDVAEEIIEAAEDGGAELIVIGLRRRSPLGKLLLGAHAQRILLDAPCPVLAVKSAR